jgi:hypothetical protein
MALNTIHLVPRCRREKSFQLMNLLILRGTAFILGRLMSSDGFEIKWDGLDELLKQLDGFEDDLKRITKQEYTEYGQLVEEGARELAPKDTGDLAASIVASGAKLRGNQLEVTVGSNLKYALRRHEEPYRYGMYPKYDNGSKFPNYYIYGRGRITLSKAKWRKKAPGRKYLTNAIDATQSEYSEMNQRILKRALGGDKS